MRKRVHETPPENEYAPQMRKHYYLDQYVIIAPQRNQRPDNISQHVVSEKNEVSHPLEEKPGIAEIADKKGGWRVKVVANDYPALTPDNTDARGVHELVLETNERNTPFGELSVGEIIDVLTIYRDRLHTLRGDYGYVSIFKNHGHQAGASLAHTHSQVIATQIIPPHIQAEHRALSQYQARHNTSALCDVIRWELTQAQRVIAHTRYMTTLSPYASQFPLEAWIVPNRQAASLIDLTDEELQSVADHLKGVTYALTGNGIDFNYHLVEATNNTRNHFYIKVVPRINKIGGYEFNTSMYINPLSPEYARKWYQKYIRTQDDYVG